MKLISAVTIVALALASGCQTTGPEPSLATKPCDPAEESADPDTADQAFKAAMALPWHEVLSDDGTGDWTRLWFLDGDKARMVNGPDGMALYAGPVPDENASHAVLWTKQAFEGDIKIEYDYTRLDKSGRGVNILYLLATGEGEAPYVRDIYEWRELRRVPTMGKYFQHMNTYHISYAAATYDRETGEPTGDDYVRARRYMPEGRTLRGTDLEPDYRGTGLFRQNVPHHIVAIKSGDRLFMKVTNPSQERLFAWKTDKLPNITEGRVGFRQMFTRNSRYGKIRISVLGG